MSHLAEQESDGLVVKRRRFLSWAIGVIGSFIAGALGLPALGYAISPALRKEEKPWADAGPLANIPLDQPTKVEYLIEHRDGWIETTNQRSAWVTRQAGDQLIVFDPRCTHLGCPYSWDQTTKHFLCPCHDGVFAADGAVISGPPPKPLARFQARIQDGKVMILEEPAHA